MSRVDMIITQLDLLNEKAKRTTKLKVSEQESRKVYDEICAVFPKASEDERVDLHIAFEDREPLIDALVAYMTRLTQEISRLIRKDKQQEAITALRQALIADVIIDGRYDVEVLQKLQNELLNAAKELHFEVESFLQNLETPAGVYVERAHHFFKEQNRAQAIRCLGRALQLDYHLRENPKIAELATLLTGEAAHSAIMTLEDSFLRNSLIQDMERKRRFQQAKTQEAGAVKLDSHDGVLKRVLNSVTGRRS
jgi:tRNA nucleotidyltransferase/poly(A) polymerase